MPPNPPPPDLGLDSSHWSALVIAAIATICAIVLIFIYCNILQHRCGLFLGTFPVDAGPMRRLNQQADNSVGFDQSQGLDSYIMHSLPITEFKKSMKELPPTSTDCAVCLGEFEDGEWLKSLPNCSHVFHVACIDTWFQTHSSCPLCRSYVNNLSMQRDHTIVIHTLLDTLREEAHQERLGHLQISSRLELQLSSSIHTNNYN
ncbi:hypothetical protein LIER_37664 [Lithospermum erythrorhizon]|uniref:RING-type E3 ubiquitin transferase n=1 Tax=Lithospermum erythrorhizon TaxID=34254 RepID=A0AAV3PQR0_LITER